MSEVFEDAFYDNYLPLKDVTLVFILCHRFQRIEHTTPPAPTRSAQSEVKIIRRNIKKSFSSSSESSTLNPSTQSIANPSVNRSAEDGSDEDEGLQVSHVI
jgi:hypothetical protein